MNCLTCGLFLVVNPAFFLEMDVTTLLCPGFKNSFLGLKKKKRGINAIFAQKVPARTYAQRIKEIREPIVLPISFNLAALL